MTYFVANSQCECKLSYSHHMSNTAFWGPKLSRNSAGYEEYQIWWYRQSEPSACHWLSRNPGKHSVTPTEFPPQWISFLIPCVYLKSLSLTNDYCYQDAMFQPFTIYPSWIFSDSNGSFGVVETDWWLSVWFNGAHQECALKTYLPTMTQQDEQDNKENPSAQTWKVR